jgi:hypothetical protein
MTAWATRRRLDRSLWDLRRPVRLMLARGGVLLVERCIADEPELGWTLGFPAGEHDHGAGQRGRQLLTHLAFHVQRDRPRQDVQHPVLTHLDARSGRGSELGSNVDKTLVHG